MLTREEVKKIFKSYNLELTTEEIDDVISYANVTVDLLSDKKFLREFGFLKEEQDD